ncbi:zinc ribbon domain-containing protein [Phenylobacterium sp.]|uniref:zinc ribbon domain-containing protein n=1 Tax=Phenylobacterium sp. TaxID=1871053 RepID=UPI002735FD93|nr:zinc ribbon domain-containing protein [Phenylobacterium sp.]MDP3855011.1 zinc ribbon domain-containing protein [Phenylobacterium sp.]
MSSICIACGMPMEDAEDHAGGDIAKTYCRYCAREDGTMQSYPEKLANYAGWLISTQGLDPTVAHGQAEAILRALPAWRDVAASGGPYRRAT